MSATKESSAANFRRRLGAASLVVLAFSWAAYAGALSVSNTQGIAFGAFAAGSGGSVVITPAGARSATGNVVLISSSTGAAAQFTVSGDADFTYGITLPSDGTVTLSDGVGHSMNVTGFTSTPSLSGRLSGAGTQQLSVGATLNVGNNQPPGAYSGSFMVTVEYE